MISKTVNYTIRIREDEMKIIEEARALGVTMAVILKKGAQTIVKERS